jgi:hypothetical protein
MPRLIVALLLVLAVAPAACGGDDADPARERPEATIARWVQTGDCSLYTDRYFAAGNRSVAEGRRACQAEADRTPPEPYRVQAAYAEGHEATVVLVVADGTRLVFSLVTEGERGWRIDDYEERRPARNAIGSAQVIAAFERRTGERLDRLPEVSTVFYEALGFREIDEVRGDPERLSDRLLALVENFGFFTIYVAESATAAERLAQGPDRRYGNVVLEWTPDAGGRTDQRFDRLDALLRDIAGRAR